MDGIIILMFLAILVIGAILLTVIAMSRRSSKKMSYEKYRTRWLKITGNLNGGDSAMRLAILDADMLLDHALKEHGVAGNTLGERMKNGKDLFSDRNGIWTAHKLRNRLAHEDSVKLNLRLTTKVLDAYKKALKDIGAL